MQNLKARWPDDAIVDSDATSKETLDDLEENEKSSNSDDESSKSTLISPDGKEDETADQPDDAGPM